jgi:hypothetical protein
MMEPEQPKPRIYLDTSVISNLYPIRVRGGTDWKAQWKSGFTWRLWGDCAAAKYDVSVSSTVLEELEDAPEPKHTLMVKKLETMHFDVLPETDEVNELAEEYVRHGVLAEKHHNDCMHLAYAAVYNCDRLVSWNFKHLVNQRTMGRARVVNAHRQYGEIIVVSPVTLLDGEDAL